jgi:DNA repair exonuclease SbcCD nuclease subunit
MYLEHIQSKLLFIFGEAQTRGVTDIVFTGDIFHKRTFQNYELVNRLIRFLDAWKRCFKCWSIIGNHDVSLRTLSIEGQPLDNLFASGALSYIPPEGINFGEVVVYGRDFRRQQTVDYFKARTGITDVTTVMVTHANLLPTGHSFYGDFINYDKLDPGVDMLLNGHLHKGYESVQVGQTMYICPGSIARVSRDDTRDAVECVYCEFYEDKGSFKFWPIRIPLTPYDDAFKETVYVTPESEEKIDVDKIVSQMRGVDVATDWERMEMPEPVREVVREFLDKAKEV